MSSYDSINDYFTRKTIKKVHKCQSCGARELDKNGKCAYCGSNWFGEKVYVECGNCNGRGFVLLPVTVSGTPPKKVNCNHCKGQGIIV